MIIGRILGTVVSTQKDERLQGKKLLIVKPINSPPPPSIDAIRNVRREIGLSTALMVPTP